MQYQQQQQQAAVMQQPFAQVSNLPAPSATIYNTLPVVQTSLGPVHPMMTPADAGQVMIESQVTSSSSLSEETEETEDSRQLTAGDIAFLETFYPKNYWKIFWKLRFKNLLQEPSKYPFEQKEN